MLRISLQFTARQLRILDLPDSDALRTLAGNIKQHTLEYLDYYLEQLTENVRKNGGEVHFAVDGEEAATPLVRRRTKHDAIRSSVVTTARSEIGAVTNLGRLIRFTAVDLPNVPTNSIQLAGDALFSPVPDEQVETNLATLEAAGGS